MNSVLFPASRVFHKVSQRLIILGLFAATTGLVLLVLACGGNDKKSNSSAGSTPGPDVASAGTCTGSKIGTMKRGDSTQRFPKGPDNVIDASKSYTARLKTVKGDIVVQLAAADAPRTVNSFVFLSCSGFFDGLTFHRYEPNIVVQGGDPRGNGTGGPGYQIDDEISPKLRHNGPGILSMANAGPNTNGSQFFITLAAGPNLDDKYSAFGKVTGGMDVVEKIRAGDKIISVSVEEK